jgi:hypothetical protein
MLFARGPHCNLHILFQRSEKLHEALHRKVPERLRMSAETWGGLKATPDPKATENNFKKISNRELLFTPLV